MCARYLIYFWHKNEKSSSICHWQEISSISQTLQSQSTKFITKQNYISWEKSEISCGVPLIAPISNAACAQRYPHSSQRGNMDMPLKQQRKAENLFIMARQHISGKSEISCGKCRSLHLKMCYVCKKISSFKSQILKSNHICYK